MQAMQAMQAMRAIRAMCAALAAFLVTPALAQPAAELRSVTGVVFAQPSGGQVRIVQAGAKLSVGDTVGTQKGAFALLVFNDGSRVALRPESAMAIRGFSFKPDDPANDQMSVQLLKGWLRNVSGQIGKRGNEAAFDMKVADTTIGIRGTDFGVRLCDDECAAAPEETLEGVLPQSGRLGQVLATNAPLERLTEGLTPLGAPPNAPLFLGDVITTADAEALLGLDDGTRIVLAPRTRVALRAEEDERGRRAVRLDVKQGAMRIATPAAQQGARLYPLLVNAGELLGVRPDSAVDVGCEAPADASAFACPAASVVLRRGQTEVLTGSGFRSVRPGAPQRLADPNAPPAAPAPAPAIPPAPAASAGPSSGSAPAPAPASSAASAAPPAPPAPPTPPPPPAPPASAPSAPRAGAADRQPFQAWDTWAPGAHPMHSLRTYAAWREQQFAQASFGGWWAQAPEPPRMRPVQFSAGQGPRVGGLFDPLDIPRDAARPPSAAERPQQGIYTAVFTGRIALTNPRGQILVPAGQGGFAPLVPTVPPRPLPAAPRFMELDKELDKSKLYPGQCPK